MNFTAVIQSAGKTATAIQVPEEIVLGLGSGKKPPVKVTINSYTYRSTIASMGGRFMIPLSAEHRTGAGVAAGDKVEVQVEPDNEPRKVVVPDDLSKALQKDKEARQFFDKLSYSNQLRHVLSVEGAKTEETRQRRIEKVVAMMHEGKV